MKIDISKLGYRWRGIYQDGFNYVKGDVVRKDGKVMYHNGIQFLQMGVGQLNALTKGELLTPGSSQILTGVYGQELMSNADGTLGYRWQEGRRSTSVIDILNMDQADCYRWGGGGMMALMNDGTVRCWGRENNGLGTGVDADRSKSLPAVVGFPPDTPPIVKLKGGYWSYFAIDALGQLWAWGYNNYGQLGVGNNTNQMVPALVNGKGDLPANAVVTDVYVGTGYYGYVRNMIKTSDGKVYFMGHQNYYCAGTMTANANTNVPRLVLRSLDIEVDKVFLNAHYYASSWLIDTDGRAWGAGQANRIGGIVLDNVDTKHTLWSPSMDNPVKTFKCEESDEHVNAGDQYYSQYMFIHTNGSVSTWGNDAVYNNGTPIRPPNRTSAWDIMVDPRIDNAVDGLCTGGWYNTVQVLKADGTLWAIGSGQDGSAYPTGFSSSWVQVGPDEITDGIKLFGGGARHGKATGVLTATGQFYWFGMHGYGTGGYGQTTQNPPQPARLPAPIKDMQIMGWIDDADAYVASYFLLEDGNLYSCGYNAQAQLGRDDDQEYASTPSPVIF